MAFGPTTWRPWSPRGSPERSPAPTRPAAARRMGGKRRLAPPENFRQWIASVTEGTVWDRIQRLHVHHCEVPLEVRILKFNEEVGEVAEAFIGMRGLNSRKGSAGPARTSWTNSPTSSSQPRWP